MRQKYSSELRLKIVQLFYANNRSVTLTARGFNYWIRRTGQRAPRCTKSNVRDVVFNLENKFTLLDVHKGNLGRPKSVRVEENIIRVNNMLACTIARSESVRFFSMGLHSGYGLQKS